MIFKNNNKAKTVISHFKQELLKAVEKIIDDKMKESIYCYIVYGQIQQNNIDGTCDVLINNLTQKIPKLKENDSYKIGDAVEIMIINNNYSNKVIFRKKSPVI